MHLRFLIYITVMSMGFSEGEARLGLRACEGNVQNAVAHIIKRREVGKPFFRVSNTNWAEQPQKMV